MLAAGGPFLMADLLTLTLKTGQIYRWCLGDANVTYNANVFTTTTDQGTVPLVSLGSTRNARGLEVPTMDMTIFKGDTAQILGINIALAAHNGALDGAALRVERAFMPTWGDTSNGTVIIFEGIVSDLDIGATQIVVHVKGELERLAVQMPPTIFLPSCANCFGDANCGISLPALTLAKTVSGGTTTQLTGASGKPDGYFQNGVVTFTSGVNTGISAAIASYVAGVVTFVVPLPAAPTIGDGFTIYPGCARTVAACASYSNSSRFRGCPFVPPPEHSL